MLKISGIGLIPTLDVLVNAFASHNVALRVSKQGEMEDVEIEKIVYEDNYVLDSNNRLQKHDECFILFKTIRSAEYALGLGRIPVQPLQFGQLPSMSLSKPDRTSSVRSAYRKIGALVKRIEEIEREINALGAVREHGRPTIPSSYLDKSYFEEQILTWKRARSSGRTLDYHAFGLLRHSKMVDRQTLQSRLDALHNEECDALIELREFQLRGFQFEF